MAESFARIFYRNAFTIGLPALEKPEIEGKIDQKDELKVVMTNYTVENIRTKETLHAKSPRIQAADVVDGGLVEYYKKYKQFPWIQR